MMWQPAKEATVPNLVPRDKLTSANSLNVAAAYGMFPVAAGRGSPAGQGGRGGVG